MSKIFPQEDVLESWEKKIFGAEKAAEYAKLREIRALQFVYNNENEEKVVEMSPVFVARRIIVNELHNDISEEKLIELLHSIGYTVLFCNPYEKDKTIESIQLAEYAKTVRAFCYNGAGKKFVFINTQKNKNGYLHSLSHELGHIVMGHLNSWRVDNPSVSEQEAEAEMFAKVMLRCANKTQLKAVTVNA